LLLFGEEKRPKHQKQIHKREKVEEKEEKGVRDEKLRDSKNGGRGPHQVGKKTLLKRGGSFSF